MAHNSRKSRHNVTAHDDDDYVYPTAKIREKKTRARNYDRSLIQKGLADLNNAEYDENFDDYKEVPMTQTNEEINNQVEYEADLLGKEMDTIDIANSFYDLDDVNTDWDHRWEDY